MARGQTTQRKYFEALESRLLMDATALGTVTPLSGAAEFGGSLYFVGRNTANGAELWKTNGTPAGTVLAAELAGGSADGLVAATPAATPTALYFFGNDGTGLNVWSFDGVSVRRVTGFALPNTVTSLGQLTAVGTSVYFTGYDNTNGQELWVTNGGLFGTTPVADLTPGLLGSTITSPVNFGGKLAFLVNGALYTTNGTSAGTTLVVNSNVISPLMASGSNLYFVALQGLNNTEMWLKRFDGTTVTNIKQLGSNATYDTFPAYVDAAGVLFFVAAKGNTPTLFKTDGTALGTVLLTSMGNFATAANVSTLKLAYLPAKNRVFFEKIDGTYGRELWSTNGSVAGTRIAADVTPGTVGTTKVLGVAGNSVYVTAGTTNQVLYSSDGSGINTLPVGLSASTLALLGDVGGKAIVGSTSTSTGRLYAVTPSAPATTVLGSLDIADFGRLAGWAYDPLGSTQVRVLVDGVQKGLFNATQARADLVPYLPDANHGYVFYMPNLPAGSHEVRVQVVRAGNQVVEIGRATISTPDALYNESDYLFLNPDVSTAVAQGFFKSGADHYTRYGINEGRIATALYSEADYLATYADIAGAVSSRLLTTGYQHFRSAGFAEGRRPTTVWDEAFYRTLYPDVATGITLGAFTSGFEHFVLHGQYEGRRPSSLYLESSYLARNPDVASAVANGHFRSGLQHYMIWGRKEGRAV